MKKRNLFAFFLPFLSLSFSLSRLLFLERLKLFSVFIEYLSALARQETNRERDTYEVQTVLYIQSTPTAKRNKQLKNFE